MSRFQENLAIAKEPAVQKYLNMLGSAEGATYDTLFGGSKLNDLSDHPRQRKGFTETTGKKNVTTAAGKYQFLESTWDDLKGKVGLPDFGPESQDAAAVELLRRSGSLKSVQAGNYGEAIKRDNKTWASLPGSPYAQKTRTPEFIGKALGGKIPTTVASNAPKAVPSETVAPEVVAPVPVQEAAVAPVIVQEPLPQMPQGVNPWEAYQAAQAQAPVAQPVPFEGWGQMPQMVLPNFMAAAQQRQAQAINFNPFGSWGQA